MVGARPHKKSKMSRSHDVKMTPHSPQNSTSTTVTGIDPRMRSDLDVQDGSFFCHVTVGAAPPRSQKCQEYKMSR